MNTLKDRFTHLNVSRQRKYQLRKASAGRCVQCSAKAERSGYCLPCWIERNLVRVGALPRLRHQPRWERNGWRRRARQAVIAASVGYLRTAGDRVAAETFFLYRMKEANVWALSVLSPKQKLALFRTLELWRDRASARPA